MDSLPTYPPVRVPKPEPGKGDDVACAKCGAKALDTGLECDECGHDNYEAVTGKPFVERCKCGYPMPCAMRVPIGFCKA